MLFTFKNKKLNLIIEKALMILVFVWPLFFISRGIDHTDSGFYLGSYKYFFDSAIENDILSELSSFFGALLYRIAPSAKFIFFVYVNYIFNCIAWIFTYKLAKGLLPNIWAWGGILIASFAIHRYPAVLSYNTFSFTMLIIALFYLKCGVQKNNIKKIFISGLIIGFSVFFRIPNALFAIFVFAPILNALGFEKNLRKEKMKDGIKQALYFTLAGFIGLFIGVIITISLEGIPKLLSIKDNMEIVAQDSNHSISTMINMLYTVIITGLKYMRVYIPSVVFILLIVLAYYKFAQNQEKSFIKVLFSTLLIAIAFYTIFKQMKLLSVGFYFTCFISIIILFSILAIILSNNKIKTYFYHIISFITILIVALGTDNYIYQYIFVLPLLVLNVLIFLNNINIKSHEYLKNTTRFAANFFALILLFGLSIASVYHFLLNFSYCDSRPTKINSKVNIPILKGMYTSYDNAKAYENFYSDIHSDEYYKNKKILVYGHFVLAYQLCDNKPFSKNLWNDLVYVDNKSIMEAVSKADDKPIILIGKFNCHDYTANISEKDISEFAKANNYTTLDREKYTIFFPEKE